MKAINILVFVWLLILSASKAQSKAETELKALQQKFLSIDNISAEFTQLTNGKLNLKGKFFYKKGNNFKLEAGNLIVVSNGKTNWNYNKGEDKVIISDYDSSSPSIFSINKFIEDYPGQCNISLQNDNGRNALVLVPRKYSLNFKTAKIIPNKIDLIDQLNIEDANGTIIKIEFSNYMLNKKLNSSFFTFNPPKGSKIIDLR